MQRVHGALFALFALKCNGKTPDVRGGQVDGGLICLVLVRVGAAGRSWCMGIGRARGSGEVSLAARVSHSKCTA